ncbi:MAG: TetR/AcrR family transcriptional regulator, partial [Hyphomicrobium sp.]
AEVLREWFASPDFHGCAFINILAETDSSPSRERDIARRHKNELLALLIEQARKDGAGRPSEAGRRALIVVEGAIVRAQMTGEAAKVAADAKHLLEMIAA